MFASEDGSPTSSDKKAFRWLISNWSSLWPKVDSEFRKLIKESDYDQTLEAIFSNEENIFYIQIKDAETPNRPDWTVDLEIKLPQGRNIFLVCLEGDSIYNSETFF